MTDRELLHAFGEGGGGDAFAEVVKRHQDWVYSVCLRGTGNRALAEDAAQAVFLALARKAGRLAGHASITGWLYRAARYAAKDAVKLERRRRKRELEVATMQNRDQTDAERWEELAPHLEPALDELPERLRMPILMRFYQRMTHAEIATALEVSEAAVEKRVARGLDKLGKRLVRRGVPGMESGGGGGGRGGLLAGVLIGHAVHPAPASLGAMLTTHGAPSATVVTLMKGVSTMGAVFKYAVAAGLVVASAGVMAKLAASYQATAATPAPTREAAAPSAATPGENGWTVELAPGVTVEILGVTKDSSQEGGWWGPDGKPLAEAPYGRDVITGSMRQMFQMMGNRPDGKEGTLREIAVRINQAPGKKPAEVSIILQNTDQGGMVKGNIAMVQRGAAVRPNDLQPPRGEGMVFTSTSSTIDVKDKPGVRAIVGTMSGAPTTASLVMRAATKPWDTKLRATTDGGAFPLNGANAVVTVDKGTDSTSFTLEIAGARPGASDPEQVIVRQVDGTAQTVSKLQGSARVKGQELTRTLKFTVNLPADKIAAIEYQTRPWEQAMEVSQISLVPGKETQPQVRKLPSPQEAKGLRGPGGEMLP